MQDEDQCASLVSNMAYGWPDINTDEDLWKTMCSNWLIVSSSSPFTIPSIETPAPPIVPPGPSWEEETLDFSLVSFTVCTITFQHIRTGKIPPNVGQLRRLLNRTTTSWKRLKENFPSEIDEETEEKIRIRQLVCQINNGMEHTRWNTYVSSLNIRCFSLLRCVHNFCLKMRSLLSDTAKANVKTPKGREKRTTEMIGPPLRICTYEQKVQLLKWIPKNIDHNSIRRILVKNFKYNSSNPESCSIDLCKADDSDVYELYEEMVHLKEQQKLERQRKKELKAAQQ
jgi:hypothetical protein